MSEIKSVPWFLPQMGAEEIQRVTNVLESNFVNEGELATEFENAIAKLCGTKYAVCTTSGTVAISLALMGLGVGKGDEVIVPDFTFIATANAVRLTGAEARLVDIDPVNLTIDPDAVEQAIAENTRAIVAVDVNGRGADYDQLEEICKKHGLFLVSDSAEALGSARNGKPLGSFGDAGCFSFSAAKTVSTGQGGMITTNNEALHDRLRELKDQGRRFRGTGGNDLHPVMGYNFKYTNLQAAVGLAQLERLPERLKGYKQRDDWYLEALSDIAEVSFPPYDDDTEYRQWTDVLICDRDKVAAFMDEKKLGNRPFWFPLHSQKPYALNDKGFQNSIDASARGLWLPSSFDLSKIDVEHVRQALTSYYSKNAATI